jgi:membrane-anchored protein YejM (alkaline phosphatase superfamily)
VLSYDDIKKRMISTLFSINTTNKTNIIRWLTIYTLCNIFVALLISLRFYQGLPTSVIGYIFGLVQAIGQLGLLSFILVMPLYVLAKISNNQKIIIIGALILSCTGLTALLADTFIYQQYRFHINAMVMELFIAGGSEIISFPVSMWLMIIGLIIVVIFAQIIVVKGVTRYIDNSKKNHKALIYLIPLCILSSHFIHIWGDATFNRDIKKQSKLLPLAYPTTAKSLMAKYGFLDIEAHKTQSLLKHKKSKGSLHYPLAEIKAKAKEEKLNIVMIVIDSWRAGMMSKAITPNMFAFKDQSLQYLKHYSGSNNTRHGMFSLMYGIPGTYWDNILKEQKSPVLMKTLIKQGYQTRIFASAKLTIPEFDQTLFADVPKLRTHSVGNKPWQRDENLTEDYLQWSKANTSSEPTFSLLFFDAAHGFSLPNDYQKPFVPSLENVNFLALNDNYDAEPFINLYKNSLHYIDSKVGEALKSLEGKLENTIVIITGDHGKEFNDSKLGYWGHNSNYSQYQTAVPLIIHWPNKAPAVINYQTSHLSIVPTLMSEALGVTNQASDYSSGVSLFKQEAALPWLFLGRNGYYAIKSEKHLYELDRLGNFTIFDNKYQEDKQAIININYVQEALLEMSRFYQK